MLNDWNWRTSITDTLIPMRTSATTRRISYERKSYSRYSGSRYAWDGKNEESSRITCWQILQTEVERKSWNHTETDITSMRVARKNELFEWLWSIPRSRVESCRKIFKRSQSTSRDSKSALYAKLRQTLATWHTESFWITGKRFLQIHVWTLESSQTPYRGIHPFATPPSATGEVPVLISTKALVAREEERIGNTIPMPTFASRPST